MKNSIGLFWLSMFAVLFTVRVCAESEIHAVFYNETGHPLILKASRTLGAHFTLHKGPPETLYSTDPQVPVAGRDIVARILKHENHGSGEYTVAYQIDQYDFCTIQVKRQLKHKRSVVYIQNQIGSALDCEKDESNGDHPEVLFLPSKMVSHALRGGQGKDSY